MESLKKMTDEQLVVYYSDGNNLAFDILLARHKQNVFNYIYFTVRNKDLAEDIFQETFIKAITSIKQGRYTETGKFKAWVTRIAHNLVIDHYRQMKNESTISNNENEFDLFNNQLLCEETIEEKMVQMQITSDIRKIITYLPDSQREVLMMRYYQNLSFKEIADKTGTSINTALGRMRYAIINMRRIASENNIVLTL